MSARELVRIFCFNVRTAGNRFRFFGSKIGRACLWCFEWVLWSLKSVCEVVIDEGEGVRQVVRVLDGSGLLGSLGVTEGW